MNQKTSDTRYNVPDNFAEVVAHQREEARKDMETWPEWMQKAAQHDLLHLSTPGANEEGL